MNNLQIELEKHKFGLERFAGSDDDILFTLDFPITAYSKVFMTSFFQLRLSWGFYVF